MGGLVAIEAESDVSVDGGKFLIAHSIICSGRERDMSMDGVGRARRRRCTYMEFKNCICPCPCPCPWPRTEDPFCLCSFISRLL